mgnify:CR=1 FL=1
MRDHGWALPGVDVKGSLSKKRNRSRKWKIPLQFLSSLQKGKLLLQLILSLQEKFCPLIADLPLSLSPHSLYHLTRITQQPQNCSSSQSSGLPTLSHKTPSKNGRDAKMSSLLPCQGILFTPQNRGSQHSGEFMVSRMFVRNADAQATPQTSEHAELTEFQSTVQECACLQSSWTFLMHLQFVNRCSQIIFH